MATETQFTANWKYSSCLGLHACFQNPNVVLIVCGKGALKAKSYPGIFLSTDVGKRKSHDLHLHSYLGQWTLWRYFLTTSILLRTLFRSHTYNLNGWASACSDCIFFSWRLILCTTGKDTLPFCALPFHWIDYYAAAKHYFSFLMSFSSAFGLGSWVNDAIFRYSIPTPLSCRVL